MKKISVVLAAVMAMVFAASCAKKATPEEAKKACMKQTELTKAANPLPPAEDPIAKVEAEFQGKMGELQNAQAQAIQAIDAEMNTKVGEAKDDAAKEAVKKEFETKKNEKAQEFAPQFQAMNQQKADAVKAATEAKAKADADAKAKAEAELKACSDKVVKDRVTKAKVDCQLKAAKLEDFNKCK